jgi:hypothetical protein
MGQGTGLGTLVTGAGSLFSGKVLALDGWKARAWLQLLWDLWGECPHCSLVTVTSALCTWSGPVPSIGLGGSLASQPLPLR